MAIMAVRVQVPPSVLNSKAESKDSALLFSKRTKVYFRNLRETTMHLAKLDGAFNFSCTWRDSPQVIPVDIFIYILGKTKKHLALLNTALYSRRTRYNTR